VPRLERQIEGLDAALVERVVEQFLVLEPEARAILLTGSYATGTAQSRATST
jgi:predicted nucleotidyltransferase